MSASGFADTIAAAGMPFTVEERGKLAVLVPTGPVELDAKARRALVAMGRAHGFTNVCVELEPVDAALSGD